MSQFKKSMLAFSVTAAMTGFGAVAQEAEEAADNTEVIQVTGIRGALQRAQAIKMEQSSIVEALSAEDIGKLPDTSVAESLARLPGLAGERRNGRTSGLSVRGFNENYVGTSLNGRELLGMGDNRGVEYDLYPSEIVANILVYKTPEAGLMTQGIGGTIDMQTVSPLNADPTFAINANFERNQEDAGNPDFDNEGHRVSFNFVDQFADDTLGVALTLATIESPRQETQFRGWGYATANPDRAAEGVSVPEGTVILGGHDSFTRSALLERTSVAAVIEYAPNDNLKLQFDALYIDFEENDVKRGIEEGGAEWGTGDYTITAVEDGLVTAGYYDGFHSVIRNDARNQDSELTTFGLNIEYAINDDWTATVDLSAGEVDKTITDVESYSGVGRAGIDGRPLTARSWTMTSTGAVYGSHPTIADVNLADPNVVRLAGPQAWGGSLTPIERFQGVDGFGPNTAQDGFVNKPIFEETLDAFRLDIEGLVEWGVFNKFTAGINYAEREKTKTNTGAYLTSPDWPSDGPIPNPLGVADLSFIGINGVVAYDGIGLYESGYYIETPAELVENGRLGDSYKIEEELLTLYTKLDIDTEIGGMFLRGNLGVQLIDVDQTGSGFNTTTGPTGFTAATPITDGDSYTDVLPTLNLGLEVAENQFIRAALGKVISRPRMDDMRPNNQVTFAFNDQRIISNSIANGPWEANAGNARLQPLEANQFDLSYENYFSDSGYYAISFFYKDLKNWHDSGVTIGDFTAAYIPGFHQTSGETDINGDGVIDENDIVGPSLFQGVVNYRQDGLQGFVRGWELQASVPFDLIHESLDGFGAFASATFLDGEFDNGSAVPGLSEESYSLTMYYENAGFEVRVSGTKRDPFSTETRAISLSLAQIDDRGGELWDAQIGYDFSESNIESLHGLRITLQGQNLTDEDTVQANPGDGRQITNYQSFGRNFLIGLNYEF
ncbi:MAG: TonB-dependent receptor [Aestuariibacter sp.]